MAEPKKTDVTQALQTVNAAQEDLSLDNAKATAAEFIKDFSAIPVELLQGMTQEYLQLKENTTYNMVFTSKTVFKGEKGVEVPAVTLVDDKGNTFINGNTVLVNSLNKVQMMPCLVKIVTGKLQKSSSGTGKYLDMDVYVLPKAANYDANK